MNHVKEIQNHRDYYLVTIPNNAKPFITKIRTVSYPYKGFGYNSESLFIKVLVYSKVASPYTTTKSLNDMNIPENNYNASRLFYTREDAERYIKSFHIY